MQESVPRSERALAEQDTGLFCIRNGYKVDTSWIHRLGKVRLSKDRLGQVKVVSFRCTNFVRLRLQTKVSLIPAPVSRFKLSCYFDLV